MAQFFRIEKVLTQLPTPLLCMSKAARSPPSAAPSTSPGPSASEASTTSLISLSLMHSSISRACPVSGTYPTCRMAWRLNTAWMRSGQPACRAEWTCCSTSHFATRFSRAGRGIFPVSPTQARCPVPIASGLRYVDALRPYKSQMPWREWGVRAFFTTPPAHRGG